jgi:GTP-binding protein YchF
MEFVDIAGAHRLLLKWVCARWALVQASKLLSVAGIVKGASEGAGLGNKFLANIRECDAIVHVVRCFEDDNVIHVDGSVDPLRDMEVINLELCLADMVQVDKRLDRLAKDMKRMAKAEDVLEKGALDKIKAALDEGVAARSVDLSEEEAASFKSLGLLTRKPVIYAANVPDAELAEGNEMTKKVAAAAEKEGSKMVLVSAQVESEMAELSAEEKAEFLEVLSPVALCGVTPAVLRSADEGWSDAWLGVSRWESRTRRLLG